jgi:hypothetical protein
VNKHNTPKNWAKIFAFMNAQYADYEEQKKNGSKSRQSSRPIQCSKTHAQFKTQGLKKDMILPHTIAQSGNPHKKKVSSSRKNLHKHKLTSVNLNGQEDRNGQQH